MSVPWREIYVSSAAIIAVLPKWSYNTPDFVMPQLFILCHPFPPLTVQTSSDFWRSNPYGESWHAKHFSKLSIPFGENYITSLRIDGVFSVSISLFLRCFESFDGNWLRLITEILSASNKILRLSAGSQVVSSIFFFIENSSCFSKRTILGESVFSAEGNDSTLLTISTSLAKKKKNKCGQGAVSDSTSLRQLPALLKIFVNMV